MPAGLENDRREEKIVREKKKGGPDPLTCDWSVPRLVARNAEARRVVVERSAQGRIELRRFGGRVARLERRHHFGALCARCHPVTRLASKSAHARRGGSFRDRQLRPQIAP